MRTAWKFHWIIILALALGVGLWGATTRTAMSRGGGGHGGGHAGGHHGGEHHPYHPSAHHVATHHHDEHHHNDHHWNHHHHDWHYAGWGGNPGFWGGAALGYGLGDWGDGPYFGAGNTYIDNSTPNNTVANTAPASGGNANAVADNSDASEDGYEPDEKMPVDVWPELGVSTYSGEYGQSKGLVVVRVMPHSAADRANLVPGDVILRYNGQLTPDDEAFEKILDANSGSRDFKLLVWDARTGRKSMITGSLDSLKEPTEENAGK